jgi:hypothetical protein
MMPDLASVLAAVDRLAQRVDQLTPVAPPSRAVDLAAAVAGDVIEVIDDALNVLRAEQRQAIAALDARILELEAREAARPVPADADR